MSFTDNDVLIEFNRLTREINEVYHNVSSKLGISDSAFIILYALVELGDGCRQADIVKAYCVNKQTINSSVKKLQKEGYIELRASKGLDRNIFVTPKGEKIIEEKIYPIFEIENSIINEFSNEEQIMLSLLTKKYLQKLKEKDLILLKR